MRYAALASIVFWLFLPIRSNADIDVTPKPWSPGVHIIGHGAQPGSEYSPSPGGGSTTPIGNSSAPPKKPTNCVVDRNDDLQCYYRPAGPDDPDDDGPEITDGDILRATRTIGLPSLLNGMVKAPSPGPISTIGPSVRAVF